MSSDLRTFAVAPSKSCRGGDASNQAVVSQHATRPTRIIAARRAPRGVLLRRAHVALMLAGLWAAPVLLRATEPERAAPSPAELALLESAFQSVIKRVAPSVVSIRVQRTLHEAPSGVNDTTAAAPAQPPRPNPPIELAVNGAGFVFAANGKIVTNEHVIQGADRITVCFSDGRCEPATVHASDARTDLAVLQVARTGLTPVAIADWRNVQRGQWSLALGNPYGVAGDGRASVSVGVVSNTNRQLPGLGEDEDRLYSDMIQTTTPIHPGNSGGPLFNLRGELIGVITAMHTRPDGDGMAFALPINPAKRAVLERLLRGERVEHGYLGLTVRVLEPAEEALYGLGPGVGVVVERVDPKGPAAGALQAGDLVLSFNSAPVHSPRQLLSAAGETPIGHAVSLEVRRLARTQQIKLTIAAREPERVAALRQAQDHTGR